MATKESIQDALGISGGKALYDEPMSLYTSIKVGGRADAVIVIEDEEHLAEIAGRLRQAKINFLPVGNLTNIIVKDGGFRGVILLMGGLRKIKCLPAPDDSHFVCAQAGASLSGLVAQAADCELTGLEFLAGIPGSVGGAVWMNAGAFGEEIKDVITDVSLLDASGRKIIRGRGEIIFSYRKTELPEGAIILCARFRLRKGRKEEIRQKMADIGAMRRKKHPLSYPSAGSVFKNLPDQPAGRLIEELGLKGKTCGAAQISPLHANFIVNTGGATAADIMQLIALVQQEARKQKGVELETEVVLIGEN